MIVRFGEDGYRKVNAFAGTFGYSCGGGGREGGGGGSRCFWRICTSGGC